MRAFEYFEPKTVGDATKFLLDHGETARILAGGVDLIPRMRKEEFETDYVVNIQRIEGLDRIDYDSRNGLRFGATATLHALEILGWVRKGYPAFYQAIHQIASVQTKYMGTVVGNLCVGTPASDVATALHAHGAFLGISGPQGDRMEPIQEFCTDYRCTSLTKGEMVTGVSVPPMKTGEGCGFTNLVRTHADIAKLTVAVSITTERDVCQEVRIAVGAAAPTVFRASKAEKTLMGRTLTPEAIGEAAEVASGETRPISDLRSTVEYRKEMTRVLVRRALEKAIAAARG
jgi:carbon-monoxide dehydrogenase medium subunit